MPTPLVAGAIEYYDSLLAGSFDPSNWHEEHVAEVQRHWRDTVPIDAFVLRPLMIDEATYAAVQASVAAVMRGFSIATERLARDESLRRAVGVPAYLEPLLELDRVHGKPPCMVRLDGIMASDGKLTLIELNSEPGTVTLQYEIERSFERLPVAREFARKFHVRTIDLYDRTYAALAARARAGSMPCIAVLDKALWRSALHAKNFRSLMHCSARGCPVLYVEPEELEYRDGTLSAHGITVDMVAFVNWELLINARKRLVKVAKAISDGAVDVFSGLSRGLLSSYKVVFELLSSLDYRDMFSAEIVEALALHIPWTRALRERATDYAGTTVDLLPFVASNRQRFVIKPAGGRGGSDVTIGRDVGDEEWSTAIKRGASQNWIVQELAVPERQSFPIVQANGQIDYHDLNCELSPYVWNGEQVDGVLCRLVAGSVISGVGDRPIGISNGVDNATWIIDRR